MILVVPLIVALGIAATTQTAAAAPPSSGSARQRPRVVIQTSEGDITLELFSDQAPQTVRRFLARSYAGSQLCESRARGWLTFGCLPFEKGPLKPRAPNREPRLDEEIDGAAMGLDKQMIDDPEPIHWLWQQEIMPRIQKLKEAGRPLPKGLAALNAAAHAQGSAVESTIQNKSRRWYLEQLGFRFSPGASPQRFTRGAVGTASFWPGEADERFVIALDALPTRDGRATVFGRVVDGWETLEKIAQIPVDQWHRTDRPVLTLGTTVVATPAAGPAATPAR